MREQSGYFWMLYAAALVVCLGTATGCTEKKVQEGWPVPLGVWRQIAPGPEMPTGATFDVSNNNLDVALLDGRLYLAIRSAPSHFASDKARLTVVSTTDVVNFTDWQLEVTVYTGKDLREPRFFVLNDQVFLYFAELGTNTIAFEPGSEYAIVRSSAGSWSTARTIFSDGTIVWRTKNRNGRVYMTAYRGGENIYQNRDESNGLELMFLTTDDGWNWHGVDRDRPVVLTGGISETGFEFTAEGDLFTVSRNEAGDATGFGSRFCTAAPESLGRWKCRPGSDPHKYDSPFMFRYKEYLYLIARYNPGGPYDKEPGTPATQERFYRNEELYSTTPKRTALYGYDKEKMGVRVLDLFPSNGDTAFAGGVWLDEERLAVFNYSSDIKGPEMAWLEGQFVGSQIYMTVLDFRGSDKSEGDPLPQ